MVHASRDHHVQQPSGARLVLIVDLWHPELETDEQRNAALNDEAQRERYRGVALRGEYETTTLRGH